MHAWYKRMTERLRAASSSAGRANAADALGRRQRRKFILVAMGAVTVVLTLIIAGINVVNYSHVCKMADARLDYILAGKGGIDWTEALGDDSAGDMDDGFDVPAKSFKRFEGTTAESPFDTRYFKVTLFDGQSVSIDTTCIAAIGPKRALHIAKKLYSKGSTSGFVSNYRYCAFMQNGETTYVVESYSKQKRFITDASHEIKTPLAVIDAANEVQEIESGESEWTQSIHEQVARLTALTERLVFLARMDEGSAGFTMASIDLSEAVDKAAAPFESVAVSRGKRLSMSVATGVRAHADAAAVTQVVELLLDNATRYASEGSVIELSLRAVSRGAGKGSAELVVSNAVDELPEGDLDRLFDRFYRADVSRSSKTGGSGVGLSVVRAIAEAHGGSASVCGHGNQITFTVRL